MPRYDYECGTCHHTFEMRQSFDSEPVATCPECENTANRKFHPVPVMFKGSGWYVNDYGKRGGNLSNSSSDSKDSSDSKTDSKTESKSESKADSISTKSESSKKSETTATKSD